ncbi:MAG: YraN family protein [Perlucidibaca sp.]
MPTKRRTGPGRQDQSLHAGSPSQRRGRMAEDAALALLLAAGHRVIQRNFHCRLGEIDLITLSRRQVLVFTEVRWRSREDYGGAAASIGPAKIRRLQATAEVFLCRHPVNRNRLMRFDVITFGGCPPCWRPQWIKGAFDSR